MSKKQADRSIIERSPGEVVRDFFNLGKVKRMVRLGSDVFGAATSYIEKPTPLNAARAVFMVGKIIVDDLEVWPEDYFDDSWESPWPEDFTRIILKALKGKPVQVIKAENGLSKVYDQRDLSTITDEPNLGAKPTAAIVTERD